MRELTSVAISAFTGDAARSFNRFPSGEQAPHTLARPRSSAVGGMANYVTLVHNRFEKAQLIVFRCATSVSLSRLTGV